MIVALGLLAAVAATSPFDQVIAAERAFAAASLKDGYHAAFAAAFMADGVVFDPVPVSAREKHADKPRASATLAWGPAWAAVSTAGDLGFTSGPWEYRASGEGAPPPSTGWFFTAWRKQSDGAWKVEADLGVTASLKYAAPTEVENALAIPPGRPPPSDRVERRRGLAAGYRRGAVLISVAANGGFPASFVTLRVTPDGFARYQNQAK
jgi:ketosteroid isomerase-like protein